MCTSSESIIMMFSKPSDAVIMRWWWYSGNGAGESDVGGAEVWEVVVEMMVVEVVADVMEG